MSRIALASSLSLRSPRQLLVVALAEDLRDRVLEHLKAGFDDDKRDDRAEPRLQGNMEDEEYACRHKRRGRYDGVQRGVLAGIDEGIRVHLHADTLDVAPEQDLDQDRDGHDDEGNGVIVRRLWVDDLLDGLHEGGNARVQHDHGDDHGAEVFDTPVAEGMLLVRLSACELRTDDRDQRAARVGNIVDRVEHDGDGVAHQTDHRLEAGKEHVGDDPDNAGFDDRFFA